MRELLTRVSSGELTEWLAYERVAGPVGPARGDTQAAIVASTIANVNAGKGRRFTPKDFIPPWDAEAAQSWQDQLAIVKQLNAMFGGADHTKGVEHGDAI